jgi:hypothetical protein
MKKIAIFIGIMMLTQGVDAVQTRKAFAENLVMTVQVANRTSRQRDGMVVRYLLPEELKREDIIETGGLQVRFDEKENALFLYDQVAMAPNESKDFQIVVNDVWQIPIEEFQFLKTQIQERVDFLDGTDDHETAKKFQVVLNEKLERIQKRLEESSGGEVLHRIETYRIALKEMEQVREQSTIEGDFVRHARWYADGSTQEDKGVIRFVITTKNPLSDKPLEGAEIKRYLPRGVEAKHVLEAEGFEVRFDPGDELFYLYRQLDLAPGETQESTITIQNVWHIPDRKIDSLHNKAIDLNKSLTGTQYEDTGMRIMGQIEKHVGTIKELQAQTQDSPVDMISNFS